MNCPHCGASGCTDQEPDWPFAEFVCGSIVPAKTASNMISHGHQSELCMKAQISQLKAELAKATALASEQELINSARQEAYIRVKGDLEFSESQLAQSVRRDDPRLTEIASELERGSNMALDNMEGAQGEDFIAWEQVHCDFANQRDKLQSIISGK